VLGHALVRSCTLHSLSSRAAAAAARLLATSPPRLFDIVAPSASLSPYVHRVARARNSHTQGHVSFVVQAGEASAVFTGDTLFVGGCGRFFEGNPTQVYTPTYLLP